MITFIAPYRNKEQASTWKARLLKKFPDSQVITIEGGPGMSFFKVWEKALPQVKGDYICLTHDDTEYISIPDLDKYFKNNVGMVGVAGTTVLHKDQPWWFSGERFLGHILSGSIYHREGEGKKQSVFGDCGEVVVLDGVCMITTKKILAEVLPECLKKDYGSWDFYDHIISLELIKRGYKLLTVPIEMVHDSKGENKRSSFFEGEKRFKEEYLDKTWRLN